MTLRPADQAALDRWGYPYEVGSEGAFLAIVVRGLPVPAGLQPRNTDLLLLLPPGFPDAGPDMFWCDPPLIGAGGSVIPGTEVKEEHLGQVWQRWSRHIAGHWRPGIDNLATYFAYVRRCLDGAAGRAA